MFFVLFFRWGEVIFSVIFVCFHNVCNALSFTQKSKTHSFSLYISPEVLRWKSYRSGRHFWYVFRNLFCIFLISLGILGEASVNYYQNLGCSLITSSIVFHGHRGDFSFRRSSDSRVRRSQSRRPSLSFLLFHAPEKYILLRVSSQFGMEFWSVDLLATSRLHTYVIFIFYPLKNSKKIFRHLREIRGKAAI